jgi:S1-C subfamily serine protease
MSRRSASRSACSVGAALGGILLGGWSGLCLGQEQTSPAVFETIQQEVQSLFRKYGSAVVRVEASDVHGQLSGTGFFIDPNGTLYTSWSVGGEARDLVVCDGDAKYPAKRLVADMRAGIAILKIEATQPTPFIPLGTSRDLGIASPVMTVGFPMDLPPTPSFGMVGGFDIKYLGRYFGTRHIRANVAVQRGQGGAPLLNMKGEAIGVLISSLDQGSASFVLPIEAAEKVRKDFVRFGEVRTGWMGMIIAEAPAPVQGSTALVEEVISNGPAAEAGIEKGDILLQLGSKVISSPEDMVDASFYLTAEDPVDVRVARDNEVEELSVTPIEAPNQRTYFPALGTSERNPVDPLKLDALDRAQPAAPPLPLTPAMP